MISLLCPLISYYVNYDNCGRDMFPVAVCGELISSQMDGFAHEWTPCPDARQKQKR